MKKLLFGLLALGAVGCQQSTPTARINAKKRLMPVAAAPTKPHSTAIAPSPQFNSLTPALLRKYDLGPLLQSFNPRPNEPVLSMHGFFGSNFYHFEVAFTSVRRDPQQPGHYAVRGKDRYKGVIVPLTGFVSFDSVRTDTIHARDYYGKQVVETSYSFLGTYELREDTSRPGAGIFRGRVVVQASPGDEGELYAESVNDSLSRGGMVLFEGIWTGQATSKSKAATWVGDLFHYRGPQIASDFFIGGREPDINPKYAKLGWNDFWANDEWWAKSPKPALGL